MLPLTTLQQHLQQKLDYLQYVMDQTLQQKRIELSTIFNRRLGFPALQLLHKQNSLLQSYKAVSYTHLDVYKRQIIKDGRVTVNGAVILKKDQSIHIDDDIIAVDGVQISTKQQYYIKFHKPAGYITAVEDPTHPVVMDLLPPEFKKMGVFPVGRLDKDTEGLLLLTNDGVLSLIHI